MKEKGVLPRSRIYFHTSSMFAKQSLYYLSNAGSYFSSNLYETKRDKYEQYLFIHVKKGTMKVKYEDQEFIATENSFIFLNCYHPHLYKALENTVFDWFHFSGNASKEYFDLLFHKSGCVYSLENHWIIPEYIRRILTMMENNKVDEHAASIIIHKILYELDKLSNQTNDSREETIIRAISYIENNYSEDISLTAIANDVKLSPYHFSRLFKKQMNCSPHQYLINYRINNAKKLLYNTKLSIKEIAFTCGFNSVSHFTTTFKKHVDVSPNKFRETIF
ncbi:helix-turn-helix domain-containing protein [Bacillus sp. FJAT-50079]|uniref:AraC family transcriptional regulator n=1 Tax=Bacillus sp. FJAT-50079 TaxID=2833577 RepID=UPI001BC9111D|nr:helix-turn-helix domain-containing protein [Bacillus sp. FJAT-50079]MBS4208866.1 helix-turn-helix transcriptional regulator [Bacillus sp. FJAT-50079]